AGLPGRRWRGRRRRRAPGGECQTRDERERSDGLHRAVPQSDERWQKRSMNPPAFDQMTRAELIAQLHIMEMRLRDDAEPRRLLHDLEVHQEELEAQQRQLVEAHQALEAARDLYADLFELAPVGYVVLDAAG